MDKKVIRSWCLYDLGNSAFAVLFPSVYGIYYGTKIVTGEEDGLGDLWWGRVISVSMLAVAVSAPFLGGIADHAGVRKKLLALYTVAAIGAVLCIPTVAPGMILTGFFIGVIANFAFEGGIVFYNAYLPEIAPKSHHGRISAKGYATGYVGSLVALVYAAVFAEFEMIDLIWVALALQWVFAALPAFKTLPADRPTGTGFFAAARDGFRTTRQTIRDVWGMRDLRWFFIAYFFYMDGVITVINFSSRYATKTLGFTLTEAMGLLALVQISALAGSLIMAGPTDRKGPKWTVRLILLWWIGVVIAAYFAQTKLVFTGVAVLAGLGLGSIQAASRAFMSRLIPPGREGEMFGFYGLCGKSGAILGPMLFGVISFNLGQRPAILSVAAFYIVGYLLLERVRTDGTVSP